MQNYWKKKLYRSDLGLSRMHDTYLNIPKKYNDATEFYGKEPGLPKTASNPPSEDNYEYVEHIDKKTGQIYNNRFEWAKKSGGKNGQIRLYEMRACFAARKAKLDDEIIVEKILSNGKKLFVVDILRKGAPIQAPTEEESNKNLIKQGFKKIGKKPKFNPISRSYRSGSSRKKNDIVKEAEIYKVTFSAENKNYVYVGQDSWCSGKDWYFGSSLIMFHYEKIYGNKIFDKKILKYVQNITQYDLNTLERKHINDAKKEAKIKDWYSVNYS